MGTTDGISTEDWDVVIRMAVDIVDAPDSESAELQQKLLDHLDAIEAKYGPLPSILATRADYVDPQHPLREELLLRAHALAESRRDSKNLVDIAHSLSELYLEWRRVSDADQWLRRLREYLAGSSDPHDWHEYNRLRTEYRKLAIHPAQ